MDSFLIQGGRPLCGDIEISGSKNAVLPILAATLLTRETCIIRKVPDLSDVHFMGKILRSLGADFTYEHGVVTLQAKRLKARGDYDLIRKMRGSICILGPLLARSGKASVSMPGGCVIGTRPIDLHLKGLKALAAEIHIQEGYVHAKAGRLQGAEVFLGGRVGPTVLGTANIMMAATLAEGVTVIESAACEPEITDLAHFLIAMGAKIEGAGSPRMVITGVDRLHGAEHEVIPDRIEAATYAMAAAAQWGSHPASHEVRPPCRCFGQTQGSGRRMEAAHHSKFYRGRDQRRRREHSTLHSFPTDAQVQLMALMLKAAGLTSSQSVSLSLVSCMRTNWLGWARILQSKVPVRLFAWGFH